MKVLVPEIAAHANIEQNKNQEIMSVDFHPFLPVFASAGAGENQNWIEFLFELVESKTVNVVRFSPCGQFVACGDAGGQVFTLASKGPNWLSIRDAKEVRKQTFRGGHTLDVQDVAWGRNGAVLASAGMDNLVVLWDSVTGVELQRFRDHSHYCQGVAMHACSSSPLLLLASCSVDETTLLYSLGGKHGATVGGGDPQSLGGGKKTAKLFGNEVQNGGTFCRRLGFSPAGGELLVVPGGITDTGLPAVHVFRFQHGRIESLLPCASLGGFQTSSLAVRFHPREFEPTAGGVGMAASRFVFAVATMDCVLVYDTERPTALAVLEKLHYASLTDLAWHVPEGGNGDGILVATSRDGCFSIVRFGPGELGKMKPLSLPQPSSSSLLLPEEVNEQSSNSLSTASSSSSVNKRR
ncbi:hypothetical protein BASA81_007520 [Batrachochytrium salamandrivorans]|nr:hypothetical protein BASA81_007520 [Batrachochytrium salamandrivorans]